MNSIIKKDSGNSGKTLVIFCGTHGNEKAGVFVVEKALKNLEIKKGVIYFVFANPKAIEQNVRFTEKNLNRCFIKNQKGETYEEKRAVELMKILDQADALLDVHASTTPKTTPFIITDSDFDAVKNMNFEIIVTGFDNIEPGGSDGYMKNSNKVGICIECGYLGESAKNIDLAYDSIIQFLQYYQAIDKIKEASKLMKKILHVDEMQKVTGEEFKLARSFFDFETIPKGTLIAADKSKKYISKKERVILFATPGKLVGAEAYFLGSWKCKS